MSVCLWPLWERWCGGQTALNVFVFLVSCVKRQFDRETMIKFWFNYLSFSWLHLAKRLSASSSSSSSFFLSAAQWNHGSASKDVLQSVVLLFWQWWCLCTCWVISLHDDWFVKLKHTVSTRRLSNKQYKHQEHYYSVEECFNYEFNGYKNRKQEISLQIRSLECGVLSFIMWVLE